MTADRADTTTIAEPARPAGGSFGADCRHCGQRIVRGSIFGRWRHEDGWALCAPKDDAPTADLRAHLLAMHPHMKIPRTGGDLAVAHAVQHYRYLPSHDHAGPNRGPDQRPPGWVTGADAVPATRGQR